MKPDKSEVTASPGKNIDIAGRDYWNDTWAGRTLASPVDPRDPSLKNCFNRRLHDIFRKLLEGRPAGLKLLEIGCAGSSWLPYFALEHGCDVTGIDYSEIGCRQARDILAQAGVQGKVHQADMFDVPDAMKNSFDVVITFGVVEHFADTDLCMKTLANYCKSDGIVITVIPNMAGITGALQKFMNRDVFAVHKVLSSEDLIHSCSNAKMETISSEYLPFFNPGAVNYGFTLPRTAVEYLKVFVRKTLNAVAMVIWYSEKHTRPIKGNKTTSSSIVNISIAKH